jgi:polysaccharide biosynthesis/export protein
MRKLFLLAVTAIFFSGCSWMNSSIMFKTGKKHQYDTNVDSAATLEYRISPNDFLDIRMYSNDGFKLIDLSSLNEANTGYRMQNTIQYIVEPDGNIKLPILGKRRLGGMTMREAQQYLEDVFSEFYKSPYVYVRVINRRVIVFPGEPGSAKVIPLENFNISLIEAIALSGGISENGKAKKVKLIRKVKGKSEIYLMDLSTIQGLKDANTVVQAGDIIYVDPRRRYALRSFQEFSPIVSLISGIIVTITSLSIISRQTK